ILELREASIRFDSAELHPVDATFAAHVNGDVGYRAVEFANPCHRGPQHRTVVATAKTAVARQYQDSRRTRRLATFEQRVLHIQARCRQTTDDAGDLVGVSGRSRGAVHRLLVASRRDQLHRASDLANVSDRLAPLVECSCVSHGLALLNETNVERVAI